MDLEDSFGRKFPYIRLSVTDQCNFRCQYCLPNGYVKEKGSSCFLSLVEITRLTDALSDFNVNKIRLTGGEPTLRLDLEDIALNISRKIPNIALTTNGYNLKKRAKGLFDAGIRMLNVSVDSLKAERFKTITGHDKLNDILEGIEVAQSVGFLNIKINVVLLKDLNHEEVGSFMEWVRDKNLSVRFIELMQTGDNVDFFRKHHVDSSIVLEHLKGFATIARSFDSGPAQYFTHPDYMGNIGIIAPYSKDFCASCNRLRITSRGELMLCLFGDKGHDLRPFLQSDNQKEQLMAAMSAALQLKHKSHYLMDEYVGSTRHLASLGG